MIYYRLADEYDIQHLRPIFTENALQYDVHTIKQFLNEPTNQLYLALENDIPVGYAYAFLQLHPDGKVKQHIESIFIAKSHRRQGIANQFLNFILKDAYEIGCHESWTSADPLNGAVRRLMKNFHHDSIDHRIYTFSHRDRR